MQELNNSDLIDYYFRLAVKDFKEEWFLDDGQKWYDHVINLPLKERTVYLLAILEQQVNNGGFDQYFVNGYGQFALNTIDTLELIGAKTTALIVLSAYLIVNDQNLKPDVFRQKLASGEIDILFKSDYPNHHLERLDKEYYEWDDNLEILLVDFLNKTPN